MAYRRGRGRRRGNVRRAHRGRPRAMRGKRLRRYGVSRGGIRL